MNKPLWVNAKRLEAKNNQFFYDADQPTPQRPVATGSYIKRDNTMEEIDEKCLTLTGVKDATAKYISNSANCVSGDDTAFVFCMTVESLTTTTTTTTTTTSSTSTTTSTVVSATPADWWPVSWENLPKMPCIPTLKTSMPESTKTKRELSQDEKVSEGTLVIFQTVSPMITKIIVFGVANN